MNKLQELYIRRLIREQLDEFQLPEYLYHLTSAKNWENIKQAGLSTEYSKSGNRSGIYLSDDKSVAENYAGFYDDGDELVLLKISTNGLKKDKFGPDDYELQDFLNDGGWGDKDKQIEQYKKWSDVPWELSLKWVNQVQYYDAIPPQNIEAIDGWVLEEIIQEELNKFGSKKEYEELRAKNILPVYHGTLLSSYNKMPSKVNLLFTPMSDDAVAYALMGGEANFLTAVKEKRGEDDKFDELFDRWRDGSETQLEILKYLFPKGDKPVVLKTHYKMEDEFDDDYEIGMDVMKKNIEVIPIDFDEYLKVDPLWATFTQYFD